MTKYLFLSLSLALGACSAVAQTPMAPPQNFEECVATGAAVTRSIPARCVDQRGIIFFEEGPRPSNQVSCKNQCGDGECQEIVCMAIGCPCPETNSNCPQDCKA